MMIAYTGLDGSGKTYRMAQACQAALRAGMDCFSTTPMKGARLLDNHRQLLRIESAHIFFDEWHQDLDAREWYHLDPVLKHIITQHRKYNLVIHWSAQAWKFMDPYVRRETMFVWDHEALFRDPNTGRSRIVGWIPFIGKVYGLHRATKHPAWEIEISRRRPRVLATKRFFILPSVIETYDSYKKIMLTSKQVADSEIQAILDPYIASTITDIKQVETVKHKRAIPDALLAAPANPGKDARPDLVGEQDALNDDEEAEDRVELSERQENADDGRAGMEVLNPVEHLGG